MALAKEIMGISLLEKSSSMALLNPNNYHKENHLWFNQQFQGRRNLSRRKAYRQSTMAAISENLVKVVPEKSSEIQSESCSYSKEQEQGRSKGDNCEAS